MGALERRMGRGGKDWIDHALSAHDDLANSCAGVIIEASRGSRASQPEETFAEMVLRRGSYFPGID